MADDALTRSELAQVLHDLKGPIVTAIGFQVEVEKALQEFRNAVKEFDTGENSRAAALESLIDEDFAPCLEHLGATLAVLRYRVNLLADRRPAESGEPEPD